MPRICSLQWCTQKSAQRGFPIARITLAYRPEVRSLKFQVKRIYLGWNLGWKEPDETPAHIIQRLRAGGMIILD